MKQTIIIPLLILLSGCASSTGIYALKDNQSLCEQKSEQFIEVFECTKQQIQNANNQGVTESAELYLLKGEQLKEKVLNNEMTNLDAKFEWQKLYVDLHQKHREFQQRAFRAQLGYGYGCRWPSRFGCW